MNAQTTTQLREIDRRNNIPKESFDLQVDELCRRLYSSCESPNDDIIVMSVAVCVKRVLLGKIARLAALDTIEEDGQYGAVYALNLELGDQQIKLYAI